MSKKIKLKIKDINELEFTILENANINDYISIKEFINHNDQIFIKYKESNEEFKELKNNFIIEEKDNIINEYKQTDDFKKILEKQNQNGNEIFRLREELNKNREIHAANLESSKILAVDEFRKSKEYIQMEQSLKENKILQEKLNLAEENSILKYKQTPEYLDLIEFKKNYPINLENEILKKEKEYNTKINDLNNENSDLWEKLRNFNKTTVKVMGEEYENWVSNQYQHVFQFDQDTEFKKDSKIGEKADFIFTVFNPDTRKKIESVTIECKTQSISGTSKNEQFFDKLERDRKKNNSQYSLLVTELEPTSEFWIKPISKYKNMYMTRPQYFVTFLSLIKNIAMKKKDLIDLEIEFEDKQKIMKDFENFKSDILDKTIKNISQNCEIIRKSAELIDNEAKKIKKAIETIIDTHIETLKNKIEKFNIKKITKPIEKLV